ncbi:MAG: bifunctional diguanylate cyclase/phosphodiesterase [Mycobacterium sp.]
MRRKPAQQRHTDGVKQWPGIATPILSALTGGGCFLLGGALVFVLATVEPANFETIEAAYANAAIAVGVGVGILLWGKRLQPWQFNAVVLLAMALITMTVYVSATAVTAVSLATLYVFAAFAAFFVSWQQAAVHVVIAIVCCVAVLEATSAVPWWSALIASVTTAAMGTVIAILGWLVSKAEHDDYTGMPNRRGFDRVFSLRVAGIDAGGAPLTLVLLRLEGLIGIYYKYGPKTGNQLVLEAVESWRDVLLPEHFLARVGDGEFAILMPGATEDEGAELSQRLREVTQKGCSAGVTSWQPGESASVLLSRAEVGLRRARHGGRNRTVIESSAVPSLATELADAIATSAVEVLYQPIVSLADGNAMVGVEALARWTSPTRPEMVISEVIRIAENSNLIAELDRYVLQRACEDVQWMQKQRNGIALALTVNVSGLDLIQPGYAAKVADILAATGWPAQRLVLEVTESVVDVDTPASIAALHELRAQGIRVAIDDFGTGYSTLSRLQTLPIDLLKLDASFTARTIIDASCPPPPLLQAIAALAQALELPMIIEGVETAEQARVLQDAGFAMGQGYFFGRPQVREAIVSGLPVG